MARPALWCRLWRLAGALFGLCAAIPCLTLAGAESELRRSEFAAPPRGSGATLFTKLSPDETGLVVQNLYDDPEMWGRRYRAYMGGAMGSGVAVGDFDGDGWVDCYVSTKTRPGRLFRNLGGWRFADVTAKAGLTDEGSLLGWLKDAVTPDEGIIWHQGAVFADINNDGLPDLFVCRNDAPNLLYINRGNGTFSEEAEKRGLGIVDGSVVGAFADFDRDGWLDVFVLTNQVDGTEPAGRPDRLFRNEGEGYFKEVTSRSGITGATFGHAATWLDYDGDRWPDLYICNDFAGPDHLYRNQRDGTFADVLADVAPHTPYSSMGADAADVDNNGYIDLLAADMATTTREKNRRGLAASRNDVPNLSARTDMAPQYMRNALLLNTGRGVFEEAACLTGLDATDWTWSVRFEDFDNDGWMDLHVTNGMVREANNSDLLARMMRALSDMERIRVMKQAPPLAEANLAFRNRGGLEFTPVTAEWGLGEVGVSFGAATGDFDRDGDLDLMYLDYDGGLSVFRNDVVGRHRVQVRLRGVRSNRFGVGAVVRVKSRSCGWQSRTMIVARGYASGSEMVAHFGLGPDEAIERLVVEWPSGIDQEFTDLEADGSYLVEERGTASATREAPCVALFQERTDRMGLAAADESRPELSDREQIFIPFRTDRRGPALAVADVDGDGHDDILLAATTGSPRRLFLWQEGRYFEKPVEGISAAGPEVEDGPVLLLDVDANGTRDLLLTRASAKAAAWPAAFRPIAYSNDGHGRFAATDWLPELSINVGAACAADFDGDGDLDLFLGGRSVPGRYPETPRSALLRHEEGHFIDISERLPEKGRIGLVKSALARDVDQDGRPDLVVALEWDHVRYLHNEGGGAFSDWTAKAGFTSGGRGWWNGLACADFNGDGRPDFAAGNLGLNTTYTASPAAPATLFEGDFAQNGTSLLVEAVYDHGELFPLRARSDLGARFPFVLRKFPRNDDFARADLAAVFGEQTLAGAQKYEADNFRSGALLSQPDGTYRFEPFPRLAQISPLQGIVAADLDGDGRADVCAVQNSDIATPAFHGGVGVFLKGKGDGTFDAMVPARSGIVVPGNGRALAVIDPQRDGRPDLFLTRLGGETEFLTGELAASRWLEVRLCGRQDNPDAIGARVCLVFSNGAETCHEIGLGGGWFTQGTPAVFAAVPENGRVVEAIVTWPDGHVTHHADAPAQGLWSIRQPGLE